MSLRSKKKAKKKKDLDAGFEAFLKESFSSDDGSLDSAKINKFLESPKKDSRPWWMQSDDDEEDEEGGNFGSGLTASGKSFLKKKKPEPKHSTPKDDTPTKPVFSKKGVSSDSSPFVGKEKIQAEEKPTDTKQKGKSGKKESGYFYKAKPRTTRSKADASMSKDSLEDISEKSEEDSAKDKQGPVDSSFASSKNEQGKKGLGMDTLDELRDKEKFFQDLEKNADGTIDYGKLNQELSQTGNTLSPEGAAKNAATLAALQDIEEDEATPVKLSQDRGNVHSARDEISQNPSQNKPSMLSKVSLMDSMESTMNTTGSPMVGRSAAIHEPKHDVYDDVDGQGSPGQDEVDGPAFRQTAQTGSGFLGTNTSQEIEALHKALREVGLSPTIKNDSQPFDLSSQGNKSTQELVQKILSGEPGKQRNVKEILEEMENLERQANERRAEDPDVGEMRRSQQNSRSPRGIARQSRVQNEEDTRGFNLSPIHGDSSARGFDQSHTEDTEMYQPITQVPDGSRRKTKSVTERGRSKKKEKKEKKDKSKPETPKGSPRRRTSPRISTHSMSPAGSPRRWISPGTTPYKVDPRSRSLSPSKPGFNNSKKFSHVKSSGYGKKSPAKPVSARTFSAREKPDKEKTRPESARVEKTDKLERQPRHRKRQAQTWSPAEVTKQKIRGSDSPVYYDQDGRPVEPNPILESQIQASVSSFAQYIQDHFSGRDVPEMQFSQEEPSLAASWKGDKTGVLPEGSVTDVKYWQNLYEEEKKLHNRVKADMSSMEKEYERMMETQKLDFEEQIFKLKQEIYVLSAKVPDDESQIQERIKEGPGEGLSKEQAEKLDKEIRDQEKLISGYQQENKRLYDQLKNIQKQGKQTEERMFNENQRMATEIANLRTEIDRKDVEIKNKGVITSLSAQQEIAKGDTSAALGAGRIAQLQAEVRETKRHEENARRELVVLQKSKLELEQHIDQLIKERESLNQLVERSKSLKSEEARALEDQYKKENDRLNRKLKWYAENQKLLDEDAKSLKERDEEIMKLRLRIQELQSETGKRLEENKVRARERAADAKRIQDLQRQVKEMEGVIRRRHPNSLPALIMTAAVAPEEQTTNKTPTMIVLENRVKKLEAELENKDSDSEKMLRAMEQKYHNVKTQYEDRIRDLETQLAIYKRPDDQSLKEYDHPHTHAVALQRELDTVRDRYKKLVADLEGEVATLKGELAKSVKAQEALMKSDAKTSEADLKSRIRNLQLELDSKDHDLQVTMKSLERLRKEKNAQTNDKNKKQRGQGRGKKIDMEEVESEDYLSLTDRVNLDREYKPQSFADTKHINDVLQENEFLKAKIDELQLDCDQRRVELHKAQAQTEAIIRRSREDHEEQIDVLRSSHQKEMRQVLANQALEHSTSKVAELQSKVDAQEVMIKHLKEQLAKAQIDSEQVSILKIREAGLKTHMEKLQDELRDAKKFHTPEMKHFEAIQEKIIHMERRHEQREQELQQIIRNAKHVATVELTQESQKWKQVVEAKNMEIQKFRTELDSILEVLRLLQRQGVVIPIGTSVT